MLRVDGATAIWRSMKEECARSALAALGNATRFRMVAILAAAGDEGELPSRLAEAVGIQRNLLGAHLLVLEKAGLVSAEKRGRNRVCRLEASTLLELADLLEAIARTRGAASPTSA